MATAASEIVTLDSASGYAQLRTCGQCCMGYGLCYGSDRLTNAVACTLNSCLCRSDVRPLALSHLSTCVLKGCSNTNDVTSYQSVYLGYCDSDHGNPYTTLGTETATIRGATSLGTVTRTVQQTLPPVTVVSISITSVTIVPSCESICEKGRLRLSIQSGYVFVFEHLHDNIWKWICWSLHNNVAHHGCCCFWRPRLLSFQFK